MELERHPSVHWDMVEIYDYIFRDNPVAASQVLDAIEYTIAEIEQNPTTSSSDFRR